MSGNQNCSNYVDLYPDPSSHFTSRIIFFTLYAIIFLFGLIGNMAVIFVTLRTTTLQSVQNMFILNLAVADIIVCLLSVPITPITLIYKTWYFGTVLCHIIPWVQGSSIFITSYILTAIAFNRYQLINRPHANVINHSRARLITLIVWLLSACATVPYACYMKVKRFPGLCGEFCDEVWPMDAAHKISHIRRTFTMGCLLVQFVIPLLFILVCYGLIFYKLRMRTRAKLDKYSSISDPSSHKFSNRDTQVQLPQAENVLRQNHRTNKILSCMVLSFGISWLPYSIVTVFNEYYPSYLTHSRYLIYLITHSIAMLNCVLNPFLYAWLNSTFKTALLTILRKKATHRRELLHLTIRDNPHKDRTTSCQQPLINNHTHKAYRTIQTDPLLSTKLNFSPETLQEYEEKSTSQADSGHFPDNLNEITVNTQEEKL